MELSSESLPLSLLQLLRNALILHHTSPYIGLNGIISLAAASKSFRSLLFETPQIIQRVDLSTNKSCIVMVQEGDERHDALISSMLEEQGVDGRAAERTLEEHLARPLDSVLGHLTRLDLLKDVRTLILDGLAVPNPFLFALLCGEIKNHIRLLSLRGVEELNHDSLTKCLRYLIRSSRPQNEPKLKGLYYFTRAKKTIQYGESSGKANSVPISAGVTNSTGAQLGSGPVDQAAVAHNDSGFNPMSDDAWYNSLGEVRIKDSSQLSGDLLEACEGLIAFDLTVCRHDRDTYDDPRPKIATIRLSGCQSCGSSPEGPAYPGKSKESHVPLVSPPPMHSSSVKAAQCLDTNGLLQPAFIARCKLCLKDRWCERCNAWWCEACYDIPVKRPAPIIHSGRTSRAVVVLPPTQGIKVHNGLCVSKCLVDELWTGGGEGGMWG